MLESWNGSEDRDSWCQWNAVLVSLCSKHKCFTIGSSLIKWEGLAPPLFWCLEQMSLAFSHQNDFHKQTHTHRETGERSEMLRIIFYCKILQAFK